jgi:hypothetical protein
MNFQMSQLFFQIPFGTIPNQKTSIENKKMREKLNKYFELFESLLFIKILN